MVFDNTGGNRRRSRLRIEMNGFDMGIGDIGGRKRFIQELITNHRTVGYYTSSNCPWHNIDRLDLSIFYFCGVDRIFRNISEVSAKNRPRKRVVFDLCGIYIIQNKTHTRQSVRFDLSRCQQRSSHRRQNSRCHGTIGNVPRIYSTILDFHGTDDGVWNIQSGDMTTDLHIRDRTIFKVYTKNCRILDKILTDRITFDIGKVSYKFLRTQAFQLDHIFVYDSRFNLLTRNAPRLYFCARYGSYCKMDSIHGTIGNIIGR